MKARAICLQVLRRIQLINLVSNPTWKSSFVQENRLAIMGINRAPIRQKIGLWCKWDKPFSGWFKLNVNGSAINGVITGGGIVRDHNGIFIGRFSTWYGSGSNTLAEFLALNDGLLFFLVLNIAPVLVESDSQVVVTAIHSSTNDNWRLEYPLWECLQLFSSNFEIAHGYHQKKRIVLRPWLTNICNG